MALDEKATDSDFANYSKLINTWELLASHLKITNPEAVALKRDSYDYNEQKIQMLFLWRRKNGSRATRRVLAEACRNAEEVALAERIEGKSQTKAKPVLATPIQATPTELSSSAPTHYSCREPIQAQDFFPEVQRMPEAPDRVQFDFPNQQSLSATSSLPSATNQQSMSSGGPPTIDSSVSSSIAQSTTATDVDLPDNELITGTSSALLSLSHVSNTEAKGLSTTSSAASATVRSPDHSISSTHTAISRDNPPSTSSSLPPSSVVTGNALQAIFKKYFYKIADAIKLDCITFATQLMSASLIDQSVVEDITLTPGLTPPHKANIVLFKVQPGLKNSKDPVKFFIDFCSVLQDYAHAKEIAIDMMRDANLSFPEAPPLVVHHNTTPTVTIPPPTHTPSAHGTAMAGASTFASTGTVAEAPSCDFSQYHDVNRYGQPTMIELLNWIVAKNPSIWNEVGGQLGISEGSLKAIQMNISFGANPKLLFKEVLSLWDRSRSRPYTWGTILDALASPIVEHVGLAQDVARKLDSK